MPIATESQSLETAARTNTVLCTVATFFLCSSIVCGFTSSNIIPKVSSSSNAYVQFHHPTKECVLLYMLNDEGGGSDEPMSSGFSMEEVPLNQIFQKAVVLQRSGDRCGALDEYQKFLKVTKSQDVDPLLYAEVHTNMGAIYAMQGKSTDLSNEQKVELRIKAKEEFQEAVKYRPGLGSAWVNLALLTLAEGKDMGNNSLKVENALKEARQCCERALGMDNEDEQSRALANKLIGDIDAMMRQTK
ncbi:hypothetical protein ACHAXR_010231 [Thalassiosira sp. AJA248-18]